MRLCLLLWLAVCGADLAQAQDAIRGESPRALLNSLEYFADRRGRYTLMDLIRAPEAVPWRAAETAQLPRHAAAFYWFRLPLHNPSTRPVSLLLVHAHPHQKLLNVYVVADGRLVARYETGSARAFASRPLAHPHFLFPLDLKPGQHLEVLLQVRGRPAVLAEDLQLWQQERYFLEHSAVVARKWFFLGLLSAIAGYHLMVFVGTRDPTYCWYSLYIGLGVLLYLAYFGYAFRYLWPQAPAWNTLAPQLLPALMMVAGTQFSVAFLRLPKRRPTAALWLHGYCVLMVLLATLSPLWVASDPLHRYGLMTAMGAGLSLTWGIALALWWRDGDASARLYCIAWLVYLAIALGWSTEVREWGGDVTGFQLALLVQVALFALAMAGRVRGLRRSRRRAQDEYRARTVLQRRIERCLRPSLYAIAALAPQSSVAGRRLTQRAAQRLLLHLDEAVDELDQLQGISGSQSQGFDLRSLVREALAVVRPVIGPQPLYYAAVDPRLPRLLHGDRRRLLCLVAGLLGWARDHGGSVREVALRCCIGAEGRLLISLRLTGGRLPALGGWREILHRLGAEYGTRTGSELWLRLPLAAPTDTAPGDMPRNPGRVLLVYRQRGYRHALAGVLRSAGYEVDVATCGRGAWARLCEAQRGDRRYQWFIAEARLGDGSALQWWSEIRRQWPTAMLCPVILAGRADATESSFSYPQPPLVNDIFPLLERAEPELPPNLAGLRVLVSAADADMREALLVLLAELGVTAESVEVGRSLEHHFRRECRNRAFDAVVLAFSDSISEARRLRRLGGQVMPLIAIGDGTAPRREEAIIVLQPPPQERTLAWALAAVSAGPAVPAGVRSR